MEEATAEAQGRNLNSGSEMVHLNISNRVSGLGSFLILCLMMASLHIPYHRSAMPTNQLESYESGVQSQKGTLHIGLDAWAASHSQPDEGSSDGLSVDDMLWRINSASESRFEDDGDWLQPDHWISRSWICCYTAR